MRTFWWIVALVVFIRFITWVRGSERFFVLETLPFVQRSHRLPAGYDALAAVVILLAVVAGIWLGRRGRR